MKFELESKVKEFTPVIITITAENLGELAYLACLFNMATSSVAREGGEGYIEPDMLRMVRGVNKNSQIWESLNQELVARGATVSC